MLLPGIKVGSVHILTSLMLPSSVINPSMPSRIITFPLVTNWIITGMSVPDLLSRQMPVSVIDAAFADGVMVILPGLTMFPGLFTITRLDPYISEGIPCS